MAVTRRVMQGLSPAAVFDVLRDGRSYEQWVVGTRAIREVEAGWPAVGTALHYTVGYGPLRKDDQTRSCAYEPERRLELEAHAWPAGTARIELRADQVQDGTLVTIDEHPLRGVARTLHNPALDLLIKVRNVETLRRLDARARRRRS
jgi:Polyketide cyclase / dehydrase and lipid transport